jgi:Arginine deiminase
LLVGQGERTTARAVGILAQNLFEADAARLVIGAMMPKGRAAMHLDTVFTFLDRDAVTIYEPVVSEILPILYTPDGNGGVKAEISKRPFLDEVKDALGIQRLKVVTTAGDEFEAERPSGTTATTSSRSRPGSSLRTSGTRHQREAREGRHRGAGDRRPGARPRARRRPLHDLSRFQRRLEGEMEDEHRR